MAPQIETPLPLLFQTGMRKENIYFIAIIPPKEISDEITEFKIDFKTRFSSSAALKTIPHITLKAPFKLTSGEHEPLLEWFRRLPVTVSPFPMEIRDFGTFDSKHKPVIFVHPVINDALHSLHKEILGSFRTAYTEVGIMKNELDFHPHITIAYRDLEPENYAMAWREYQSKRYEAAFIVNSFHLLQHDSKKWNVIDTHILS
jgi:2'-5' RNA ligase